MSFKNLDTYWIIVMGTGMVLVFILAVIGSVVRNQRNVIKHHQEKIDLILSGERRYRDLFHGVSDIVYVHTVTGEIIEVNQRGADLVHMSVDEIRCRNIKEFFPRRYHQNVDAYLEKVRRSGESITGLMPYRSLIDGRLSIYEYTSSFFEQSPGAEPLVRGIARDVSAQVRSTRSLQRMGNRTKALLASSELAQKKLSILSHSILRMQEEDRRTVSRELHDEVSQLLVAIGVNLDMMNSMLPPNADSIHERIRDTQRITEDILHRVRKVLREFRSLEIDQRGLLPSVRSYIEDYSGRTGIRVRLLEDDLVEILGYEQKAVIYRIIQESMTNAAKYAQASEISITMECRSDELALSIDDNGVGFDVDNQQQDLTEAHLGILGMDERVKIINGRFSISSHLGQGTQVRVNIPFNGSSDSMARTDERSI